MKFLLYLLFLLFSCNPKTKEKGVVGIWEYKKMEFYDGTPVNLSDSLLGQLHQSQKGLTFSFTAKNVFKVTQRKANKTEEFMAEQPYELSADHKNLRLKNTGRPDDNFSIIELSDSLLKINIFYSEKAYMVFEKKG